ncbi:MAG: DUF1549 domain-containing protein [Planctomycetes bacterium]|nr:DUF1549 domain-containing protein [Planctomycetota bacterium]
MSRAGSSATKAPLPLRAVSVAPRSPRAANRALALLLAAPLGAQAGVGEWSYSRLTRLEAPATRDVRWVSNPIDAFVLARLEAKGLAPNPRATDATLIRRATYDLTGLPPSPEDVAAYVADRAPDKYERLLDRLLASPQYGETWGRHWLDVVRFAETDSFERDRLKPAAWRYRDWVIDAFNHDKPYARFVLEQLAGDELPDASFESIVATGYYRLGIWDDEPTDPAQAVYDDFDGIVDTTARAFLGISMGCARCHEHKKDPIPARDYYRMLAFFEGLKPYKDGGGNATTPANYVKQVPVDFGHERIEEELAAWRTRREALLAEAKNLADEAIARLDEPSRVALAAERDAGLVQRFDRDRPAERRIPRAVQDDFTIAFRFASTEIGRGRATDPHWFSGSPLVDGEVDGVTDDFGVALVAGHVAAGTGNPDMSVHSSGGLADGAPHHVAFTRTRGTGRIALYVDGVLCSEATGGTQSLAAPATLAIGRIGAIDDLRIYARALDAQDVLDLCEGGGFSRSTERVVEQKAGTPESKRWRTAVDELLRLMRPVRETVEVLCAQESGTAIAPSFVRQRGNVHSKGDAVRAGFPEALGGGEPVFEAPAHGESSGRRLAFARWLLQADHPRTWRVLANRIWQHHFGRGIVRSSNDFGRLGDEPTHPELLDWLACEIVATGGRLKAIHRLVMSSSAYRMASDHRDAAFDADPRNDRFWRFERRRLTAEELRDSILCVDGSLDLRRGGPGVYPPMPAEVLATSSRPDEAWGRSSPEDAARRSVYVHVKRSLLMPLLSSFDLADTDTSCPVRFVTTLPTQALTMLNSEFTNERARVLAERLARERPGDERAQLARGVELVTQRPARDDDLARLTALAHDLRTEHAASPDDALRLCCLALLNLNEFVHLD